MSFRLFGFEVRVHASFFLVALLLAVPRPGEALSRALTWVAVVTVSVLIHELGHAFAARRLGKHPHIELYSLGGLTRYESDHELAYHHRIAISVAGPAAGFALGAVVFATRALVSTGDAAMPDVVRQLIWVNVGWGALNLLPMLPLDGGHVLQALVAWWTDKRHGPHAGAARRAVFITYGVSIAVSLVATLAALQLGMTWAALIAGLCGVSAFGELRRQRQASRRQ